MAWLWPSNGASSQGTPDPSKRADPLPHPPSGPQPAATQKPHQCEQCHKSYSRLGGLQSHRKVKHGGQRAYMCRLCSRTFTINSSLVRHMRLHSGDRPYPCDMCEKRFTTKTHLERHNKSHTGEKPHQCKLCSKRYKTSTELKYHARSHNVDTAMRKPFRCPICAKSYPRKMHLTEHMKIHSGSRPYKCVLCPKQFPTSAHLSDHKRAHSDVRPYNCHGCSMAFKKSSALKDHMRQHTGDTPYKCPICYQGFRRNTTLKMHLTQHKNDPNFNAPSSKMFHCNICGQIFQFKQDFRTHRRTHVNEKLYQCIICAEGFKMKTAFHSHWTSHSGLPSYECKICGKILQVQGALVSHRRQHPDNTPYQCAFCLLAFYSREYLVCHLKTHISAFEDKIINQFTEKGILEESLMRALSASSRPQGAFDEAVLSTLCDDDDKISQSMESFNPPPEFPAFSPGCYSPPACPSTSGSLLNQDEDEGGDAGPAGSPLANEADFSALKPSLNVDAAHCDHPEAVSNSTAEAMLMVPPSANQWATQFPDHGRCPDDLSKHAVHDHLAHVFNTFADFPDLSVSDIQGVYGSSLTRSSSQDMINHNNLSLSSATLSNVDICVGQNPQPHATHHSTQHTFTVQSAHSNAMDSSPTRALYDHLQNELHSQSGGDSYFHQEQHPPYHLGVDRSLQPHEMQQPYHAYGDHGRNNRSHGGVAMATHVHAPQQQLNTSNNHFITNSMMLDAAHTNAYTHLKHKDTMHSTDSPHVYFPDVANMDTHTPQQHQDFSCNLHEPSDHMACPNLQHHAQYDMQAHFNQRIPGNDVTNSRYVSAETPSLSSNMHRDLLHNTGIPYPSKMGIHSASDYSETSVVSRNLPNSDLSSAPLYTHHSEAHSSMYDPPCIMSPSTQTPHDLLQLDDPRLPLTKDYSEVVHRVEPFPHDENNESLASSEKESESLNGADKPQNMSARHKLKEESQETGADIGATSDKSEDHHMCDLCNRSYQTRTGLQYHQRSAHALEKPFKCDLCKLSFSRNFALKRHQLSHSGERQFTCDICKKTFFTRSHLQRHMVSLHSNKKFPCSKCEKVFTREEQRNRHLVEHGEVRANVFKCDTCDKFFRDRYRYNDHKNSHSGVKPYICHICSRDFAAHESLKRHVKIHGSEKPHVCAVCKKGFMRPVDLKKHMATHGSGEYRCSTCDIPFSHEATLKKHMRTHEQPKSS